MLLKNLNKIVLDKTGYTSTFFDSSALPKVPPIQNKKSHKIKSAGIQFSTFRF
jgi:hypothetical protein